MKFLWKQVSGSLPSLNTHHLLLTKTWGFDQSTLSSLAVFRSSPCTSGGSLCSSGGSLCSSS